MAYPELTVDASPHSSLVKLLIRARMLAGRLDARVSVVSYAWPRFSVSDLVTPNMLSGAEQERAVEKELVAAHSAFDEVFASASVTAEWCSGIGNPDRALLGHLLTSDLLVSSIKEPELCVLPHAGELTVRTGVPVLILGEQKNEREFQRILVAWKDTAQARRALHLALPILALAEEITVVGVGDEVSSESLSKVVRYLQNHGVRARDKHMPLPSHDVCAELFTLARHEDADLIVAGIRTGENFVERFFGETTQKILKDTSMSWFLSN